ncbi:DUF1910 domain-containing protein [Paenibacillus lentus]|uniref:DUF1910 domain-containing protein n=1 Tax=Paenibacillus lentus TaxID=1338368 RepID=A0A3Q8S707_9BACL|nr:DUF1910 domain-containing protein [Paenibacillus lentus]
MRDHLCNEDELREGIGLNIEFIEEKREDINSLKEEIKNGIQRNPNDNHSIIEGRYLSNFLYEMENIRAKYSLGNNIETIKADFENAITDLENVGRDEVGYIDLLWMISLGILIETDKRNIERLGRLVEKQRPYRRCWKLNLIRT